MHRQLTISAALLAAACGSAEPVRIELTPEPWARSLVLALSQDNATLTRLTAMDLAPAPILPDLLPTVAELDADATAQVFVLAYPAPLATYGLTTGVLGPSLATTDPMGVALPRPREALTYTVGPEGLTAPTTREDLPPLLRDYRLARPPVRCPSFETSVVPLDARVSATFNVAIDATHVMVGLQDGSLVKVSVTGEVTPYRNVPAGFPAGAAALDDRGRHWFAGAGGVVWRGVLTDDLSGIRPLSTSSTAGNIHWIAVAGDELYTLGSHGEFQRFDGTWRMIHAYPFVAGQDLRGGVVRLGAGEAVAGFATSPSVVRDKAGTKSEERPAPDGTSGIVSLASIPGVGLVASNAIGEFFAQENGVWRPLPGADTGLPRDAIVPFEGGFLYGGVGGLVGTYSAANGFCPLEKLSDGPARYIVQLGDTYVLAGPKPDLRERLSVTLLKRAP